MNITFSLETQRRLIEIGKWAKNVQKDSRKVGKYGNKWYPFLYKVPPPTLLLPTPPFLLEKSDSFKKTQPPSPLHKREGLQLQCYYFLWWQSTPLSLALLYFAVSQVTIGSLLMSHIPKPKNFWQGERSCDVYQVKTSMLSRNLIPF